MYSYIFLTVLFVSCNADYTATVRDPICTNRNGYYQSDNSCDSYFECREYQATPMTCPDGLHFNPKTAWPGYACSYPMDVNCEGRGVRQPAQPTASCPHQYGFFPHPDATPEKCGQYVMCTAGTAFDMLCPQGLAFNPVTSHCDWPDQVPYCNTNRYLGFQCPAFADNTQVVNFKYEGNCHYFFSCEKGEARLLSCDPGFAFDTGSGQCVNADLVHCQ
ncbi:hypothetical protein K1T71_003152 [Dendrolimus kikuchii]|uniref:Uncharacterized protein n=1 Tax=Dendrolimus kikuchii TaxID=765133 RepID=A0ACC1DB21_9NEOP|nr:hypothetical protein K1T71_003152 [Dendrolimus kikuchii]